MSFVRSAIAASRFKFWGENGLPSLHGTLSRLRMHRHRRIRNRVDSQMKELVARFRCEVVEPEKRRTELRILPTPIYRYEDPKRALDGCVFAMCRDGDHEAILILE